MGNFKDLNKTEEEITKIKGRIEYMTLLARRDDFLAKTKLYQMKSKMRIEEYDELFNRQCIFKKIVIIALKNKAVTIVNLKPDMPKS